MEQTFYIIKPEAINCSDQINFQISSEFKIVEKTKIALTENDLKYLAKYDLGYLQDPNLFETFKFFMRQDVVQVGILEKFNAIKDFQNLCGLLPNPKDNLSSTLRNQYGKPTQSYNGIQFFLNAIHKSQDTTEAQHEIDLFHTSLKKRTLLENSKELAKRVYDYPHSNTHKAYLESLDTIWNHHIIPVVDSVQNHNKHYDFNLEETLIAGYFHDVGRIIGDDDNHHTIGAEYMSEKLLNLGVSQNKIERIYDTVLNHRGSVPVNRKTIESQVLASADGFATIQYFPLVFHSSYSKHNLKISNGVSKAKIKLQKAWNKLMPEIKPQIKETYSLLEKTLTTMEN